MLLEHAPTFVPREHLRVDDFRPTTETNPCVGSESKNHSVLSAPRTFSSQKKWQEIEIPPIVPSPPHKTRRDRRQISHENDINTYHGSGEFKGEVSKAARKKKLHLLTNRNLEKKKNKISKIRVYVKTTSDLRTGKNKSRMD